MKRLADHFASFLFLGMAIVALIAGLVLFSYLLLYGALVGAILFLIFWLKEKIFPDKKIKQQKPPAGRIIDHDK